MLEDPLQGLGNVTLLVDLNRQSLDRVVPGIRIRRLDQMFRAAGWQVLETKYGSRLQAAFDSPGGETLRRRIDEMPNEEYQGLIRRTGAEQRERLLAGAGTGRPGCAWRTCSARTDDAELPRLISDLGGHDTDSLVRVLDQADADRTRPSVIFAYTVKGWRLPFAGDPLNHSAMLNAEQIAALAPTPGRRSGRPVGGVRRPARRRAGCSRDGAPELRRAVQPPDWRAWDPSEPPAEVDVRIAATSSTQQVLGDALAALARVEGIGRRIVTASPDVSVSTNLGGWINRVGVFSADRAPRPRRRAAAAALAARTIRASTSSWASARWTCSCGCRSSG